MPYQSTELSRVEYDKNRFGPTLREMEGRCCAVSRSVLSSHDPGEVSTFAESERLQAGASSPGGRTTRWDENTSLCSIRASIWLL